MKLRKSLEERLQRFCRVPRLMLAVQVRARARA